MRQGTIKGEGKETGERRRKVERGRTGVSLSHTHHSYVEFPRVLIVCINIHTYISICSSLTIYIHVCENIVSK